MIEKIAFQGLILGRILLEYAALAIGIFRLSPLFRRQSARPKRIAFQAYSIHLAQHYQTIIAELLKESAQYEIFFIVLPHPHFSRKSRQDLKEFAERQLSIPAANIHSYWQTLWEKFDLIVFDDVYAKFPLRSIKKCLIQHGVILNERWMKRHFFRKTIADFDIILLNGEFDYNRIKQYYQNNAEDFEVHPIGFPFLDRIKLLDENPAKYLGKLSQRPKKMNVLVAPSWSGLNLLENNGIDYLDEVVAILSGMDVNTIVKLHACSYNKIMAGGVDWKKHLAKYEKYENIKIDYDVDDIPAIKYCDVLITDISSRSFNFLLLEKPVIYYFPTSATRENGDTNRIAMVKKSAVSATSPENIREILSRFMNNGKHTPKQNLKSDELFTNYGNATAAAVDIIKQSVNDPR